MTALKKFSRLECQGVWRPAPEAQRQNVIVSFGDATVAISNQSGQPLSHWSLAAIVRTNRNDLPAIYTPSADGAETLEISDETMVDALEAVRTAILKTRARHGRVRSAAMTGLAVLCLGLLVAWGPAALVRQTVSLVPDATRDEIGRHLSDAVFRLSGRPCRSESGGQALTRLAVRLSLPPGSQLTVVPGGVSEIVSLPGGAMLVPGRLVEDLDTPEGLAGFILAESVRQGEEDPLVPALQAAGAPAVLRLLTTGHLPDTAFDAYAEALAVRQAGRPTDAALLARFGEAQISSRAYAYAVDVTGEMTLPLIEADPHRDGGVPVLSGEDWTALQSICSG